MGAILQQTIERWFTPEFVLRRPEVIDRVEDLARQCKGCLADDNYLAGRPR